MVGLLHVHVRLSSVARSQSEQRRTGLHAVMVVVVVVYRIGVVDSSRLAASARKYWCPSHVTHYEMEVLRAVCNGQRQPQRSPPIGGSIEPLRGGAASFSARRTMASGSLRGRHR